MSLLFQLTLVCNDGSKQKFIYYARARRACSSRVASIRAFTAGLQPPVTANSRSPFQERLQLHHSEMALQRLLVGFGWEEWK